MKQKLIIIGSGPAALTAAIYASRANLSPLVIEGPQPGGQLTTTTVIENFPGFENGISGVELIQNMKKQAQRFGAVFLSDEVKSVDFSQNPYIITTNSETYETQSIIICTGARSRTLGLKNEQKYWAKGVHTCATCDGFFYKNKQIIVIGGGDSAMEEALFLSKFASKVYIVHRSDILKASQIMRERARNNAKIVFLLNSEIKEYIGKEKIESVKIFNSKTLEAKEMPIDGIFMAVGHIPNTDIFKNQLKLAENGYIVAENNVFTDKEGIFVAGDVSDWHYRQAIVAAGFGCMAEMQAEKYLSKLE
jgi:thioredoxin reductase (NADPH)